ncbi:MAG TPA: M50 family metallopeptidase, partial [Polyangiaceae bacterium]|nr:M50 family metallopeptidase [Polyangiaceae bacterium]
MFGPLYAILGLAVLMVVHEAGHFFVARAFGMRVERFAIGIGPTVWKVQPKGSATTYQIGLIPFLAYVQVAGMNPFEEIDPDDKGCYANGSLLGRISVIVAGPLANYVFASLVFLVGFLAAGKAAEGTVVMVDQYVESADGKTQERSPAYQAGLQSGDRIVAIDGADVSKWEHIPSHIQPKPTQKIQIKVERQGQAMTLPIVPSIREGKGFIGVRPERIPLPLKEAILPAIEMPARIVAISLQSLGRMLVGQERPQFSGPLGLMRETKKAADAGIGSYLSVLGVLSTSLAFFNMLPIPALDGGRLMFLTYEAVTRR